MNVENISEAVHMLYIVYNHMQIKFYTTICKLLNDRFCLLNYVLHLLASYEKLLSIKYNNSMLINQR